jgi:hypothetical protein
MTTGMKTIIAVCALLAALGGLQPLHDVVLCVGEDGQMRVEWAYAGTCVKGTDDCPDVDLPMRWTQVPEHRCGSCTDVPLPSGTLFDTTAASKTRSSSAPLHTMVPGTERFLAADLILHGLHTIPPHDQGISVFLKTTILLI